MRDDGRAFERKQGSWRGAGGAAIVHCAIARLHAHCAVVIWFILAYSAANGEIILRELLA